MTSCTVNQKVLVNLLHLLRVLPLLRRCGPDPATAPPLLLLRPCPLPPPPPGVVSSRADRALDRLLMIPSISSLVPAGGAVCAGVPGGVGDPCCCSCSMFRSITARPRTSIRLSTTTA